MAKLNINGQEVEIELTEEQVREIRRQSEPEREHTGYERVKPYDPYYYISTLFNKGIIYQEDSDTKCVIDDGCYSTANYFSDKFIASDRVRLFNVL